MTRNCTKIGAPLNSMHAADCGSIWSTKLCLNDRPGTYTEIRRENYDDRSENNKAHGMAWPVAITG